MLNATDLKSIYEHLREDAIQQYYLENLYKPVVIEQLIETRSHLSLLEFLVLKYMINTATTGKHLYMVLYTLNLYKKGII